MIYFLVRINYIPPGVELGSLDLLVNMLPVESYLRVMSSEYLRIFDIFQWSTSKAIKIIKLFKRQVVSIDLFSVFFMPFLYNGVYYRWSNRLPPPPPPAFVILSAQTTINDDPSYFPLVFTDSVLL